MRRVVVARSLHEIEQLRPAWENLEDSDCTLFQSYAWNRVAAEVFCDREQPFVVLAESDSGTSLIPAAIARQQRQITFLGDGLFDYRDVLASGDRELQRAAWAKLADLHLPLSVTAVRGEKARESWCDFGPRFFTQAPLITRGPGAADALVSAHRRLGRFWRRALRGGAQLRQYDGTASDLLRWIYERKAAQLGPCPENLFLDPLRVEFMVAVGMANARACDIFVLERGSDIMSALVTFRDRDTRRFYTVFYDSRFADYSPGSVLLFEICRRTLEQGLDCDLMTGEQPYKFRLATASVPLFRVEAPTEVVASAARLREPVGELAA